MRIELNGIGYARPRRPVVVVCIDGGDPAYLEHGFAAGEAQRGPFDLFT